MDIWEIVNIVIDALLVLCGIVAFLMLGAMAITWPLS